MPRVKKPTSKRPKAAARKSIIQPASLRSVFAELVQTTLGPAAREIGYALENEVKAFKHGRAIELYDKLCQKLKARKVDATISRKLPIGIGTTIIRAATEEDDDEVVEFWAGLAASGIDPKGGQLNKVFIAILKDISAVETYVLKFIWFSFDKRPTSDSLAKRKRKIELAKQDLMQFNLIDRAVAVENLIRLGCIQRAVDWTSLDQAAISSSRFSFTSGGGGTLQDIDSYLRVLKHAVGDLAGRGNPHFLVTGAKLPNATSAMPEANHRLANLGIQLMLRVEPT